MRKLSVRSGQHGLILLGIALASIALAESAAVAAVLIGVDAAARTLIQIDTNTGASTVRGPVGDDAIAALTFDVNHGILYGTSTITNNLFRIDPSTGATTEVGSLHVGLMHGLAYDSVHDKLYGTTAFTSSSARALYEINVSTGGASRIGGTTFGVADLAYDPVNQVMYGATTSRDDTPRLYRVNLGSGALTVVGPLNAGTQVGVGLAYDPVLGLFASDNKSSLDNDDQLYKIDTSTGQASLIGNLNAGNVLGLAFVPEPSTGVAAALAFCALALSRRRRGCQV